MIPRKHAILYLSWQPLKDTASSFARLVNSPFFAWDNVVWNTQTLEEVCKTFQVEQNETTMQSIENSPLGSMIALTELNQEMGLYD